MKLLQALSLVTGALGAPQVLYHNYGYEPLYRNLYNFQPANYDPLIPYSVFNQGLLDGSFSADTKAQLLHTTAQHLPTTEQLLPPTAQHLSSTEELLPTIAQHLSTTEQLLSTTKDLLSTTTQLLSTTAQLTQTSSQQTSTGAQKQNTLQSLANKKTTKKFNSAAQTVKTSPVKSQTSRDFEPDADIFANAIANEKLKKDERVKAINDFTSPSAAAALAYMKNVAVDDLCGKPAEIYLQTIFAGNSKEDATAEATRYYIKAYNGGERVPESGACKASEIAFREAYASGEDPILKSAQAFINNWPGIKDGNPCAVSGIDYINAIIEGKTHPEASTIAAERFAKAFTVLAKNGKPLKDVACAKATKAFFKALPDKPDPANAAAFTAFIDKLFEDNSKAPAFDPVCLASLDAFLEAYNNGEDLQTANLISARAFFKEFAKGSSVPADSACAAATKAYTAEIQKRPSQPNSVAMLAYINEAIANGARMIDPVCAKSAEAYFDAYIEKKTEEAANEAAAVAYIQALEDTPDFDLGSPCGKAAEAYIKEYEK